MVGEGFNLPYARNRCPLLFSGLGAWAEWLWLEGAVSNSEEAAHPVLHRGLKHLTTVEVGTLGGVSYGG